MKHVRSLLACVLCCAPTYAAAEVKSISEGGFTVTHELSTNAAPEAVYGAVQKIGQWWNPDHSWTGQAANLYLDASLGGCFCERLPDGGGVEHLRIIYLAPGQQIRFDGALGPLQGLAVSGRMLWTFEPAEDGTRISFTYHVSGVMDGGFEGLAPAVDGVIGEQLTRLGAFLAAPEQ